MEGALFVGARVTHIHAGSHGTILRIGRFLWPFDQVCVRVRYDDGLECSNFPSEFAVPDRSFT